MNKIAIIIPFQIENASLGNAQRMMQVINFLANNKENEIDIFCDDYSLTNEFKDENLKSKSYYRNVSKIKRVNVPTHKIDDWICPDFYKKIKKIVENDNYDLVWCNYPFMSKYLDCFNAKIKVIDLHDNFLHRNEMMGQISWFSTNSKELYKSFSRTNFVLSISEKEFRINRNIFHNVRHIYLPYLPDTKIKKYKKKSKTSNIVVGFIGSVNSVNVNAIKHIENIAKKLPNLTFKICGKIGEYINSDAKNLYKLGFIENMEDFYSKVDLTISPTFTSTGQKIKVIESIMQGVPCLTSPDSKPDFVESFFANNLNNEDAFIKTLSKIDKNNLFDIISIQQDIIPKLNKQIDFGMSEILKFKIPSKYKVVKEI